MSFYNQPTQHRLKKPKEAFPGIKKIHFQESMTSDFLPNQFYFIDLDNRKLKQLEKERDKKILQKLIFVFILLIAVVFYASGRRAFLF
jgi:hypothetical protein